jgi:hypothetical protein
MSALPAVCQLGSDQHVDTGSSDAALEGVGKTFIDQSASGNIDNSAFCTASVVLTYHSIGFSVLGCEW